MHEYGFMLEINVVCTNKLITSCEGGLILITHKNVNYHLPRGVTVILYTSSCVSQLTAVMVRLNVTSSPGTSPVHSQVLFGLHVDGQFTRSSPSTANLYTSVYLTEPKVNVMDAISSWVLITLTLGDGGDGLSAWNKLSTKHPWSYIDNRIACIIIQ